MKKVLVITYYFPPSNDIAVHRVLRMGKWLPRYGWEPVILTPDYTFTERIDNGNLKFVEKYFKSVFRCSGTMENTLIHIADRKKRNIIARFIRWLVLYNLNPDVSILWKKKAVSEGLKIIEEQKIDAIWATIGPPTSGIIGAELKKKSNVPFLIDYRDPWTLNPYNRYSRKQLQKNMEIEHKMLSVADTVIATSTSIRDKLIDNGYFDKERTFVVTNGYDEELQWVNNDSEESLLDKNRLQITYTGAFYGDRQPFSFIEGLNLFLKKYPENRNRIKFNIIGNLDPSNIIRIYCRNAGLSEIVFEKGLVPYRVAMQYLKQSDLLLLVNGTDPESKIFIPGKLFDYLATGKPIMFIGAGEPAKIVEDMGVGIAVPHDPIQIENALAHFILDDSRRKILKKTDIQEYSSERVAMQLSSILNQLYLKKNSYA